MPALTLRRIIDLALLLFLSSSVVALWTSYDLQAAAQRLALVAVSALSFIWVTRNGRSALRLVSKLLAFQGLLVSAVTLFLWLMRTGSGLAVQWGQAVEGQLPAGLITLAVPFMLVEWLRPVRPGREDGRYFWLFSIAMGVAAVLVSDSRASQLMLLLWGAALAAWTSSSWLAEAGHVSRRTVVAGGSFGIALLSVAAHLLFPDFYGRLWSALADVGRLDLAVQGLRLLSDFVIIGGGLGVLPGLYAHYIRGLPVPFVPHTQNLYLNVGIELGLIGLAALVVMYAAALLLAVAVVADPPARSERTRSLALAALSALGLVVGIGLIDDPIYATWGLPLLFLPPALAYSISATGLDPQPTAQAIGWLPQGAWLIVVPLLVGLAALGRNPLLSSWHANLGAIEMAKIELRGWPSGKWSDGALAGQLEGAETMFRAALAADPANRTALHRLGLIAMERRDYAEAVDLLNQAYAVDPGHRGVRKALGFSLVWIGDYQRAADLLAEIPEATRELAIYGRWWATRGRPDLSGHSNEILILLAGQ